MVAVVAGSLRIFENVGMKALKKRFEPWFIHSLNKHSLGGKYVVDGKLHDSVFARLFIDGICLFSIHIFCLIYVCLMAE